MVRIRVTNYLDIYGLHSYFDDMVRFANYKVFFFKTVTFNRKPENKNGLGMSHRKI